MHVKVGDEKHCFEIYFALSYADPKKYKVHITFYYKNKLFRFHKPCNSQNVIKVQIKTHH